MTWFLDSGVRFNGCFGGLGPMDAVRSDPDAGPKHSTAGYRECFEPAMARPANLLVATV
jgi:hypothetical protein